MMRRHSGRSVLMALMGRADAQQADVQLKEVCDRDQDAKERRTSRSP